MYYPPVFEIRVFFSNLVLWDMNKWYDILSCYSFWEAVTFIGFPTIIFMDSFIKLFDIIIYDSSHLSKRLRFIVFIYDTYERESRITNFEQCIGRLFISLKIIKI